MCLCGGLGWWFGGSGNFKFFNMFFEKRGPTSSCTPARRNIRVPCNSKKYRMLVKTCQKGFFQYLNTILLRVIPAMTNHFDIVSAIPVVRHKAPAVVSKIGNLIGEVSCCDEWMAQRTHFWTEKWLRL